MLKMVDGTGIIGVDMVCPLGVSTPQPPNYDRVELEGAGMLVLPNSLDAPLERLELGGKTTQMSTRGVNLWSKESKITFTATKQVVFDTPIPAGDYVVSANVTSNDKDGTVCLMLFYYTDSGSKGANLTRTGRSSAKITFTSNVKHVVLYAGSNANGSANDTATFADIQLEKGSTATAYEPYTGGKPSPSPEYPQEIKNVGKWNEETQKYKVDVKITNAEQNWSKEQTLTLTSDRPITKWDKLVEQGGQIGWLYGTKKYTVTGSENYIFGGAQYYSGISTNMYTANVSKMGLEAVCDRLTQTKGIWNEACNNKDGFTINGGNQIHMRFFNSLLGVNDDATMQEKKAAYIAYLKKEYEKGTPYEIVYQSLEPEFIPLPQSEQNAIRALKTYYPTTVITVDGGELDPDIKVTYRKEI